MEAEPVRSTSGVMAPGGVSRLSGAALDPDGHAVSFKLMERLVDAMAVYQERLGDSRYSLRDIEPSLERLEKVHDHLRRITEESPADSPLQNIINEGLVTTAAEISRFRNGGYC
jgi:hypothetical protein